jgi:hypothetical protein
MDIALDSSVKAADFNAQDVAEVIFNGASVWKKPAAVQIFGASWDGGESPVLTRTDGAANFDNPDPYVNDGNHPGYSPFDNVMPWAGVKRVTIDGNELVEIPKFWFKVTKTGAAMTFQIANYPAEGFYVSPAHANRGDGVGERDYVYAGRYHCASDYKSKSGVIPITSITRANARTGCHALGNNYWQFDFAMFWTTRLLYIVEMANFDSQAVIGYGTGNNSSTVAMGYTDMMPYHTGTMAANRTTYGADTQYRYMEGLWDNVADWCDGIVFRGSSVYVHNTPSEYNDSRTNYTLVGTRPTTSNCIKSMFVPTVEGYEYAMYPSEVISDSSYSKYFTDGHYYDSGVTVLHCGGSLYQGHGAGMFRMTGNISASTSSVSVGARLMYLPS